MAMVVQFQELKTKYDIVLEAKARLEDEVDSLQSKVGLTGKLNCAVLLVMSSSRR